MDLSTETKSIPRDGSHANQTLKLDSCCTPINDGIKNSDSSDNARGVKRKIYFDTCNVADCCIEKEEMPKQKNIWNLKRGTISIHTYNTLLATKDPFMKSHYVPRQKDAVIVRFIATAKSHILGEIIPNDLVDTDWKYLLDRVPQVCDDFRSNTVRKKISKSIFIL